MKRIFAFLIDTLFNLALCLGALGSVLWKNDIQMDVLLNPSIAILGILFLIAFNWALITAQEIALRTTLAKKMFGLVLNGTATAIFLRAFFFLPSVGFCGLGLLWAAFDRRKRCWHDIVVDVQPIEIARI